MKTVVITGSARGLGLEMAKVFRQNNLNVVISDVNEENLKKVGEMDTELIEEFFLGFVRNSDITLHINQLAGKNSHHIIEGGYKAFARALGKAISVDEKYKDEIPSTKGVL